VINFEATCKERGKEREANREKERKKESEIGSMFA